MSVTLSWRPAVDTSIHFKAHHTNQTQDILERAFGELPITLGESDTAKLSGMASTIENEDNIFSEIIHLIGENKSIEILK